METKPCSKCKQQLEVAKFAKDKSKKSGYASQCLECQRAYQRQYAKKNAERKKQRSREYRGKNVDYDKNYYSQNRTKKLEKNKEWRDDNKERLIKYRKENSSRTSTNARNWETDNHEKAKNQRKQRMRRYRQDPVFRMKSNASRAVRSYLNDKGLSKSYARFFNHVDYTPEQLRDHLEAQFDDKMSWDNYGSYWHIDHIKPQSLFHFTSMEDEEFRECWALENLRPLEAIANIKKSNKF